MTYASLKNRNKKCAISSVFTTVTVRRRYESVIGITLVQEHKTQRALESLRDLSAPRALVLRDGKELRIPSQEVVPDDVMVLHEGDRIAADAQLISGQLSVDESLLTGESVSVDKTAGSEEIGRAHV